MTSDEDLKQTIIHKFGQKSYTKEGILNRDYLAEIVFSDQRKLQALNDLVHPAVMKDSYVWFENQKKEAYPYAIKESALLYEIGISDQFDQVIVVSVPLEIRIDRVMKRDDASRDEILKRINKQMSQAEKDQRADHIIYNSSWDEMRRSVKELDALLRSKIQE